MHYRSRWVHVIWVVSWFIFCCTILTEIVFAEWPSDPMVNVPISTIIGGETDLQLVSDGAGGAIITWQDSRQKHYDIYVQRVDANGTVLWTIDGVPISTADGWQGLPDIVSDGAGGAIITWYDAPSSGGSIDIYANRVDANGTVLWSTGRGILIAGGSGDQHRPQLVSDSQGGAIITWQDSRFGNNDIYAQRVDANGNILWTINGVPVCTAAGDQQYPQLISDGQGGAIITWTDSRNGDDDIYTQRVDANGNVLWTFDGVPVSTAINNQYAPQLTSDNEGGAIITWVDPRNGNDDIYAQRVDVSGAVRWTVDGVQISRAVSEDRAPQLMSDGQGGAIITWGHDNIYAQRLTGNGLLLWMTDGLPIATAGGRQSNSQLVSDGQGGAIIIWHVLRDGYRDIYAQRVDAIGTLLWTIDGVPISTAALNQQIPKVISDGAGGAIGAWEDERNKSTTFTDIYAQNINPDGTLGGISGGLRLPDLTLDMSDITFSPENPVEGDSVDITATIHNLGVADASNVLVRFFDGDPGAGGTQIGTDQVIADIGSGGRGVSQVMWDTTRKAGSHDVYVVVDPTLTIEESIENNNKASKSLFVIPKLTLSFSDISPDTVQPGQQDVFMLSLGFLHDGQTTKQINDIQVHVQGDVQSSDISQANLINEQNELIDTASDSEGTFINGAFVFSGLMYDLPVNVSSRVLRVALDIADTATPNRTITLVVEDEDITLADESVEILPLDFRAKGSVQIVLPLSPQSFKIELNDITLGRMPQEALDGFRKAADIWESLFIDPITVRINIDFQPLANDVLGNTDIKSDFRPYSDIQPNLLDVERALINDRKSQDDDMAVANLPIGPSLTFLTNDNSGNVFFDNNSTNNNNLLDVRRANAKALGLLSDDGTSIDATITLNSNKDKDEFDYDPNDGIESGKIDFVKAMAHEIGHALGFGSGVNFVDLYIGNSSVSPDDQVVLNVLDLYRYSDDSVAQNTLDLTVGGRPYFSVDGGVTGQNNLFSTGSTINGGDGEQAGHWKDNQGLGFMDPNLDIDKPAKISTLDIQAFDVIGWDLAEGVMPANPLLPQNAILAFGKWTFDLIINRVGLGIDTTLWIDPDFAVGYDYDVTSGPNFASVTMPTGIGDDVFSLYIFDQTLNEFVLQTTVLGGTSFDFTSIDQLGENRFRIAGIEESAGLDPNNPLAFPTGVTFVSGGDVTLTMTPLTPIEIVVDIKPDSDDNSINLKSKGVIPVAVLSTDNFDATRVDGETVRFGLGEVSPEHGEGHLEDVDNDGDVDWLGHFPTQDADFTGDETEASIKGQMQDGQTLTGSGAITFVGGSGKGKKAPMAMTAVPEKTQALTPFPSPSNPEVWIPYHLSFDSTVVIKIYDIKGQLVRELNLGFQPAGFYASKAKAAYWDGRNDRGEKVSSGIYFYHLQAGDYQATKKMLIRR